jgi:hypothetical protein
VTSEFHARSFDRTRQRPAPESLSGHWLNGDEATIALTRLTLVVVIKSNCDGCREFLYANLEAFRDLDVVFVSATDDALGEWAEAPRRVLVAPALLASLEVTWPPFYVLIEPATRLVVCEGVVFAPAQVATEIASFLLH